MAHAARSRAVAVRRAKEAKPFGHAVRIAANRRSRRACCIIRSNPDDSGNDPRRTHIRRRSPASPPPPRAPRPAADTDTRTWITRKIGLNIPIVSSAMDTVTESHLAIALAQQGGIGLIHRNMSIDRQSAEVDRV